MNRLSPLLLPLPYFALLALAAPVPKEPKTTPISVENAHQIRSVLEVPKRAYRITRGPKRGELILFDYNSAAEVVDDVNLRTIRPLAKDRQVTDIAASPDGKLLVWNERGKSGYTIQETKDGKTFDVGEQASGAAFSRDGKLLALGFTHWARNAEGVGHSEMRLYDLKGKLVRTLERNGPGALRPVFSPDGKTLAVSNRNYETQLFDVATGKLLHKLDKRMTQEIAFSPDGKTLACGYVDGTVVLWDVATGKQRHSADSGCKEVYSVDWSPKGDVLATSGREGKVALWGAKLTKLHELDAAFWVIRVRFSADGGRLLTASAADWGGVKERKITVWAVPGAEKRE